MMTLQPSLARFKELAKTANLIAVTAEISMDLDTPVSVYCKLVGEAEGFILESVDTTHQQFGRYSFIGAEPFIRLQVFKNRLMIRENDLMKCFDGTPQETLKKYMEGFRPAVEDEELPLANGGMVGYLNYEIAATFDRHPAPVEALLHLAHQRGATSILLTNRRTGPLVPLADILLTTPLVTQEPMFRTRVATLVVLEAMLVLTDSLAPQALQVLRGPRAKLVLSVLRDLLVLPALRVPWGKRVLPALRVRVWVLF